MPADRLYTDNDVAAVVDAIYGPLPGDPSPGPELNRTGARLHAKGRRVLDALTAAGWRHARDFLPAAAEALDRHAARHRAQVAEEIARAMLARDPAEWALAGQHAGEDAARIAREVGGTTVAPGQEDD